MPVSRAANRIAVVALASQLSLVGRPAHAQVAGNLSLDGLLQLDATVESASGRAEKISEAPAVISSITREELIRRGYRSVGQAIDALPNIVVLDDHVRPTAIVRGISGGYRGWGRMIKVMIDGQNVAFQSTKSNYLGLSGLSIDVIDRIEVLRGPVTTLYGADAYLGVVNIITRKPDHSEGAVLAGVNVVETHGGADTSAYVAAKSRRVRLVAAASFTREDRSGLSIQPTFDGQTDGQRQFGNVSEGDVRQPLSAYVAVSSEPTPFGEFTVSGWLLRQDTYAEFQDYSVLSHRNHIVTQHSYARLQWKRPVGHGAHDIRVDAAWVQGGSLPSEELWIGGGDEFLPAHDRGDTYFERRQGYRGLQASAEANTRFLFVTDLKVGLDTQLLHLESPERIEILASDRGALAAGDVVSEPRLTGHQNNNVGAYAQARIPIVPRLVTTAGARVDQNSAYGANPAFRLATVWRVADSLSLKAAAGTSTMAPSGDQLYSERIFGTGDIMGNEDLVVQKARTLEASADLRPTDWMNSRITVYDTVTRDQIEFERIGQDLRPVNAASVRARGIEGSATVRQFRFDAHIAGSFGRAVKREDGLSGDDLAQSVPYSGIVGLTLNVPELKVRTYLEARLVGPLWAAPDRLSEEASLPYQLPPNAKLNIHVSTRDLRLFGPDASETVAYVGATNVLDTGSSHPGYHGYDVPQVGRSYFAGVRQTF